MSLTSQDDILLQSLHSRQFVTSTCEPSNHCQAANLLDGGSQSAKASHDSPGCSVRGRHRAGGLQRLDARKELRSLVWVQFYSHQSCLPWLWPAAHERPWKMLSAHSLPRRRRQIGLPAVASRFSAFVLLRMPSEQWRIKRIAAVLHSPEICSCQPGSRDFS